MNVAVQISDHAVIQIKPVLLRDCGITTRIDQVHIDMAAQAQERDVSAAERAITVIDDPQAGHVNRSTFLH